ncbi:hypothetical protein EVAR_3814_1 [Eumeta japonica]|uniref:Uncharacterized protein n=1 Tax=Eumeta variegata TaxID=151549 RepID=A0A4C1SUC4_EUMVA|nr:hypothetical protein EVAR_3814_1 [Eumeta japonica]
MEVDPIPNLPSNLMDSPALQDPTPAQNSVKIGTSVTEKAALSKPTVQDYRNLITLLVKDKIPFHIHPRDEEQKMKAVIRGIPPECQLDEVKNDLINQYFPI